MGWEASVWEGKGKGKESGEMEMEGREVVCIFALCMVRHDMCFDAPACMVGWRDAFVHAFLL